MAIRSAYGVGNTRRQMKASPIEMSTNTTNSAIGLDFGSRESAVRAFFCRWPRANYCHHSHTCSGAERWMETTTLEAELRCSVGIGMQRRQTQPKSSWFIRALADDRNALAQRWQIASIRHPSQQHYGAVRRPYGRMMNIHSQWLI